MTEKEAIENLKEEWDRFGKATPCDTSYGMIVNESYKMAIAALEKQMPKKPVLSPDCDKCDKDGTEDCTEECNSFKYGFRVLVCPNCGEILQCKENNRSTTDNCCGNCGQAIDWN